MNIRVALGRIKRKGFKQLFKSIDFLFSTNLYWEYSFRTNGYHANDFKFDKDQIAFVHIPKTGGTSFYRMLEEQVIKGMVNTRIHRPVSISCPPKEYKYITIMRDPRRRVWSLYQMVLRSPIGSPYQKYAKKGLPCFLENCWEARDMTCRYLSGDVYKTPQEQTYDRAWANLNCFEEVFDFENFSEEVQTYFQKQGKVVKWTLNERKSKYLMPQEAEIKLITKYNKYDLLLFQKWKTNKSKKR